MAGGGTDTKIRAQKVDPGEENSPAAVNHEPPGGTLTTELSRSPEDNMTQLCNISVE